MLPLDRQLRTTGIMWSLMATSCAIGILFWAAHLNGPMMIAAACAAMFWAIGYRSLSKMLARRPPVP